MERTTYDELEDKVVVETIYDPTATIEQNAIDRANGPVMVGSKGQQMMRVASIPMEHLIKLEQMGYDILSSDPDERRRALTYIQQNEQVWMTTDKQVFARSRPKWQ